MIYERISDNPEFIEMDYLNKYKKKCTLIKGNQDWYKGTGISIEEHPLSKKINMSGCKNCESNNVKVIAAQRCVHMFSGDVYWDYELFCIDCSMLLYMKILFL